MTSEIFSVWFLMGAALVFWMQAGFAMVETGFTRAKKCRQHFDEEPDGLLHRYRRIHSHRLQHFCWAKTYWASSVSRALILFTNYANFDWSNFVFNLVFCATTATIVSGAMAERTKFLSYCIYSGVISALVYPIEAHWIWGGGWLSQLGFHDFAGSCAIHMVGGLSALIGAKLLGPRIGKFERMQAARS